MSRPDPLVIDLGCGPGSLAVRLLEPSALPPRSSPWMLTRPARAGPRPSRAGPGFVSPILTCASPAGRMRSSWTPGPMPRSAPRHCTGWPVPSWPRCTPSWPALRPGGLPLNGDHLEEDEAAAPVLVFGLAIDASARITVGFPAGTARAGRAGEGGHGRSGPGRPAAERERRHYGADHHRSESTLRRACRWPRAAGSAEVGTLVAARRQPPALRRPARLRELADRQMTAIPR